MKIVSLKELQFIIESFQKNKCIGIYGFSIEFYDGFFDLIGKDFLLVVEESRKSSKVLGVFNSTFCAMIPKKDIPNTFDNLMYISLYNVVYNIIAKIV